MSDHWILKNGVYSRNHHVYEDGCKSCDRIKEAEANGYRLVREEKVRVGNQGMTSYEFESTEEQQLSFDYSIYGENYVVGD